VALWAGAPMAIVLTMPYTEGLFVALAAWALVGVLEQKWWLAGVCTVFAGLVRSTALALIAVVVVAAGIAVYRGGRGRWPALACVLAAPLGLLGYWGSVAARTGSLTGWQDIERRGWNVRWDFGAEAKQYLVTNLLTDHSVMQTAVTFLVLGAVALAVLTVTGQVPWPLAVYGIGVVILAIGTAGLPWEKIRFLLPAFTVLIPVAIGLAGRKAVDDRGVCRGVDAARRVVQRPLHHQLAVLHLNPKEAFPCLTFCEQSLRARPLPWSRSRS
jgi:hypothetical protein